MSRLLGRQKGAAKLTARRRGHVDRLLTRQQAVDQLGISVSTLDRWIRRGVGEEGCRLRLPVVRTHETGGRVLIRERKLEWLLEQLESGPKVDGRAT